MMNTLYKLYKYTPLCSWIAKQCSHGEYLEHNKYTPLCSWITKQCSHDKYLVYQTGRQGRWWIPWGPSWWVSGSFYIPSGDRPWTSVEPPEWTARAESTTDQCFTVTKAHYHIIHNRNIKNRMHTLYFNLSISIEGKITIFT